MCFEKSSSTAVLQVCPARLALHPRPTIGASYLRHSSNDVVAVARDYDPDRHLPVD